MLANDSLSVAYFLGLGANEKAPDHSTLTLFKNRLLKKGGEKAYEELFEEITKIAQEEGQGCSIFCAPLPRARALFFFPYPSLNLISGKFKVSMRELNSPGSDSQPT